MKRKNGFTLIELLAVIVILAIIMIIATMQVNRTIKKSRENANEINKKTIKKAAQACYVQEGNEEACDSIDELIAGGYLDEFKDPFNGSSEYINQNYAITFSGDGEAVVKYYGEGYIDEVTNKIKSKNYFTWDGTTITGLTSDGLNWVKDNNWILVIPNTATRISTDFVSSPFCTTNSSSKTVIIPGNVDTVEHGAFVRCGVTSLYLNSGTHVIEYDAFFRNSISNIRIPDSSISVGRGAFSQNQLPDDQAFIYRRTKTGIDYTTLVAYGGKKKSDIVVPENVTIIDNYAFYCGDITSITLPSKLKVIGSGAFQSNYLTSLIIPDSVETIEDSAFKNNYLTGLDVSKVKTVQSGYVTANNFPLNNAIVYDKNDKTKVNSFANKNAGAVVIPEGVKEIMNYAFTYVNMSSITLPESLEKIGNSFQVVSGLSTIKIPKNVSWISNNVFYETNLSKVIIDKDNPHKEEFKNRWEDFALKKDIIVFE